MPSPEHLIFGPTVEGLFVRGLGQKLTPELVSQLRAVGLDVEKRIAKAYPRQVISDAISIAARGLYPDVAEDEGWYRIGKHVVVGLKAQPLMSATVLALRVAGPRLTTKLLARTFRQTNNYMRVTLVEHARSHFELELWPSNAQPRYMQAVIEDMLNISGARQLVVAITEHDPVKELARYDISFAD
jgi:uncharacterized protein (TIGR02265 family)